MRVLIACEFSGVVREAFSDRGHDAWSCDLLESEIKGNHLVCDVFDIIDQQWDMMIAFPPCTHLCVSGARWFKGKKYLQQEAIDFFKKIATSTIPKICVENPIGIMSTHYRKPDQIIQPWQFGHGETKATCLWLRDLPKLNPEKIVSGRSNRIHWMGPKNRSKERSRTYQGIAKAMANQWG